MTHNCKNFDKCGNTVERIATIRKDNFYICFDCRKENSKKYYRIKLDNPDRRRIYKLHCENMINYWTKKLKHLNEKIKT